MPQFDVYRDSDGVLLVDCQADVHSALDTRFVAPLLPAAGVPRPFPRLHPIFDIDGEPHLMATHVAAAVPRRTLSARVTSLAQDRDRIIAALDTLLTGV
jgi:toxin CcdB